MTLNRLTNIVLENLYLAVGVLGSIFFALVLLLPSFSAIPGLRTRIDEKSRELTDLKIKSERLGALIDNQETLEENLRLVDLAIPSQEAVPTLMTQIQTISADSGVLLKALQFGGGSAGNATGPSEVSVEKSVKRVYLQTVAEGPFANLQSFLRNLEMASRLVTVESVAFEAGKENDALTSTLGLVSYYLETPPVDPLLSLDLKSANLKSVLDELKELRIYEPEVSFSGVGKANPFE